MNPDSDPDPGSRSCYFRLNFFCWLLFEGSFTLFFKDKKSKESQNSRIQDFSYYFCMMIEGNGSGSRDGSGSIPLTSGSGSGRPKTCGSGGSGFGSGSGTLACTAKSQSNTEIRSFLASAIRKMFSFFCEK
jgi:hypothetical protein